MKPNQPQQNRLISIDAFRAVTLLLMIFVNDFWTLRDIPYWLGHADAADDALWFSDVIFPAFLFIVGLSVPIAIRNRLNKNDPISKLTIHIILRSLALLVIGLCHVNLGNYSGEAWLSKSIWSILTTVSFFLIWLDYPQKAEKSAFGNKNSKKQFFLQATGVILLAILLMVYKGDSPEGIIWMRPQWWGILGLIGWAYLIVSLIFLYSKGNLVVQFTALVFFLFFNAATQLGWLQSLEEIKAYIWIVGDGSMPALVTAGVITSVFYTKIQSANWKFWVFIAIMALIMITFGLATRPLWEISKIRATPSWTAICIGISAISFAFIVFLVDIKGIRSWYNLIKPAGVSTLTCYLIPYVHIALLQMIEYRLPVELRTGAVGLTKSFIFSLFIIQIVALLQKRGIRLKL